MYKKVIAGELTKKTTKVLSAANTLDKEINELLDHIKSRSFDGITGAATVIDFLENASLNGRADRDRNYNNIYINMIAQTVDSLFFYTGPKNFCNLIIEISETKAKNRDIMYDDLFFSIKNELNMEFVIDILKNRKDVLNDIFEKTSISVLKHILLAIDKHSNRFHIREMINELSKPNKEKLQKEALNTIIGNSPYTNFYNRIFPEFQSTRPNR